MSFAKDAIGFYLQVEDQMSPVLAKAVTNYEKFTKQLTDLNKKSYQSTQSAMDSLASITKAFDQLPKKAAASYAKTLSVLKKKMKPLTQRVDVVFTPKSEKTFSAAIAKAVSRVLSRVQIRLGAAMPLKRARGYDNSQSLRAAYKETVQPPDMRGGFQNLPRFAEGGEVTGGQGKGIDDVLALLSKGEIVLPSDLAEKLKAMAAAAFDSSAALGKSEDISMLADVIGSLALELAKLKSTHMDQEFDKATKSVDKLDDTMEDLTDTVEESNSAFGRLLQKTLGPAQFLAIQRSIDDLQRSFGGFEGSARDAFGQVAGGEAPVLGFIEALNEANVKLDLSRDELAQWKADLLDLASAAPDLGPQQIGQAFKALSDAGSTNRDFLMQMSTLTAQIAETTGIGFDQAGEAVYRLGDAYGFTDDQIADVYANIKAASKVTAISLEELSQQQMKNLDNLGAFFDTLDTADQRAQALRGINQFAASIAENWGEAGGQITDLFSQALSGNRDAQKSVQRLGVGVEELRMAAERGDFSMVLDDMTRAMTNMSGSGSDLAELAKIIEFPGTPAELSKLVNSGGDMAKTLANLQASTVPTSEAINAMEQSTKNVTTGFERFKRSVGGFLAEKLGADTLEFFEDFNVQAAFATARLAQMSVEFGTAAVKAIFFNKATKGTTTSLASASKATEKMSTVSKGGMASKGGGFLGGLARGLGMFAHPKVILGLAVITGTVFVASKIVVSFIEDLAKAAKKNEAGFDVLFGYLERFTGQVIAGFIEFVETLKGLNTSQILATAGSLLVIGPSLTMIGTGLAALGVGALSSIPGLYALGKVLPSLGGGSEEAGSLAGVITGLMKAFDVDPALAVKAAKSIGAAALFMAGLAAVTLQFGVMKTAALLSKANPLEGIAIVFGQGSLSEMLESQAAKIVETVDTLSNTFGNISKATVKKMQKAAPVISGMASFLADYALIAASMAGIKIGAAADKLMSDSIQLLYDQSSLSLITEQKGGIVATVKALSDFGDSFTKSELDGMKAAAPVFEAVADFLSDYAEIADIVGDLKPSVLDALSDWYVEAIGGDSPMAALQKSIPEIRDVLTGIATEFSQLDAELTKEMLAGTASGIQKSMDLIESFSPVVEQTEALKDLTDGLESGFFGKISDWVGLTDSPLDQLKKVMMGDGDKDGIIGVLSSISTFIADKADKWQGLLNIKATAKVMSSVGSMMADMLTAAESFVKAGDLATSTGVDGIIKARTEILNMFSGIVGTVEELSGLDLEAQLNVPVTTKAEINKAVRVDTGDSTDRPLLSAAQETNMLLSQILTAVRNERAPRTVTQTTPGAVRATKDRVRSLAEGGD